MKTMQLVLLVAVALTLSGCWLLVPPSTDPGTPPAPPGAPDPVLNQRPLAVFEISHGSPIVGEEVCFDATYARDPDGVVVAYRWAIAGHGIQTASIVCVTFLEPARYRVALTVQDDQGKWSQENARTLIVTDPPAPPGCGSGGCS